MFYNGYTINTNYNLLIRKFTKTQTRKFTNRRWCKKYLKKYSKMVPDPSVFVINKNTLVMHPAIFDILQKNQKVKLLIYKSPNIPKLYTPPKLKIEKQEKQEKLHIYGMFGMSVFKNPNLFITTSCA